MGREMKLSLTDQLERLVRQQVRQGADHSAMDVDSLIILVMMQAAKEAEEDLRSALEEVRSVMAAKRRLREILCRVRRDISDNRGAREGRRRLTFSNGMISERAYHRVPFPVADCSCAGGVKLIPTDLHEGTISDVAQLEWIRDDLQAKLDSMNEMSDMTSLRLQMMMDRRAKFISTLSNIMKKLSDTQSNLTQNLK